MNFLLPKQTIFFKLFGQLTEQLEELVLLFAKFSKDFNDFSNFSRKAKEIEARGDNKTHEIIDHLNKTFVTPFDREDIYLLAHELDDIIDLIENVVHNVELYQIKEKFAPLEEFAQLISEATGYLSELIKCLEKNKYSPELASLKLKVHTLEDRGDLVFERAISQLFLNQKDPIALIKQKDILESLENVVDKYQAVADIIEGIIVKSS